MDFLITALARRSYNEKSEVVASNVDHLLARISLLCKKRLCEDISSDVPSCRAKEVVCVHGFRRRCHSDLLSQLSLVNTFGVQFCRI